MRLHGLELTCAFLFIFLVPKHAIATIIVEHVGANDPASEGFTFVSGGGVATSAVINDMGSGVNAWVINDSGLTPFVDFGSYNHAVSVANAAIGQSLGWRLATELRAVSFGLGPGEPASYSVGASYANGATVYGMHFMGSQGNADITVLLTNETPLTLTGIGDGYHLYELIYDPIADSVDFFADGNLLLSGVNGEATALRQVNLAGADSRNSGQGNYSLLQFSVDPNATAVVPEPTSIFAWVLAVLSITGFRCYRLVR